MGLETLLRPFGWRKLARHFSPYLFALSMAAPPGCSSKDEDIAGQAEVHDGITDSRGEAHFTDAETGEDVSVRVEDETGNPLPNTEVNFFDGTEFECFTANHGKYTPGAPLCYEHNSFHRLRLTASPLQVIAHDSTSNERSRTAASRFVDWAEAGWDYRGCRTPTEMRDLMESGGYMWRVLNRIFSFGLSSRGVDAAVTYAQKNWDDDLGGHVYFFNPSQHGFRATGTLWTIDARRIGGEIAGNSIDDDCDGEVDERSGSPMPPQGGNVEITLEWDQAVDLDLHLYAPDGCHIYYGKPSCNGGTLGEDTVCDSKIVSPERITWNRAPAGTYRAEVRYFSDCASPAPVQFGLHLTVNGRNENHEDVLERELESREFSFEL